MKSKIIFFLGLSLSVNCAAEIKIGLVDMQKAIVGTLDGQRVSGEIENELKTRQTELKKMEARMQKMSEEFSRKEALLARDFKEKRQAELQAEMRKFREAITKNQTEMENRQRDLIQPIVKKLNLIIANLGKKEGFTMIVSRPEQLILYAAQEMDLTDRVVREYNRDRS